MGKVRLALIIFLTISSTAFAQNPVPFVNQPLVPDAVAPGGPAFTLTVNGTGFVSGATVNWNGAPLATTFVSQSQLTAAVPAANIATAGTATITVANPGTAKPSNRERFAIAIARPCGATQQTPTAYMTIKGGGSTAGDVGIGTTTPAARLDVEGGGLVVNGGDVGIGTTSPQAPLNVAGTTAVEMYDPSQSSGNYSYLKTTAKTFNTQALTLGTTQGYNTPIDVATFTATSATAPAGSIGVHGAAGQVLIQLATPGAPTLTAENSGGTLSGTYYYEVSALNAQGETFASAQASVTVSSPNNAVNVSWTSVSGASSYRVYCSTSSTGSFTYYTSTSTSYTDTACSGTSGTLPNLSTANVAQFARAIWSAVNSVAYSLTPTFDLSAGNIQQFTCTATTGVTVDPSFINLTKGELMTFIFVQTSSGTACALTWPTSEPGAVHGGGTPSSTHSSVNVQTFAVSNNGSDLYATGPMQSCTSSCGTP